MKTKTRAALAGLALTASAVCGNAALAAPQAGADAFLAQAMTAPTAGTISAIVKTTGPLTAPQKAQIAALSGTITARLPIINSLTVTLPARSLAGLAALPFVTHLSYNGEVKKCDEFTVASSGSGQAYQQYKLDGTGITVAVIDSGINGVPDFSGTPSIIGGTLNLVTGTLGGVLGSGGSGSAARLIAAVSFVPGSSSTSDTCGHGTHVAGLVAGNGTASSGLDYYHTFYGTARNANLVNVRVLDANGAGTVSAVVSGIQWVINNKSKYGIKVINLSLGHPVGESYKTDPLCQAVESAWKAGIVVVCAAGNEGRASTMNTPGTDNEGWGTKYGSIDSPGNDPYVITVGATKSTDGNRADDKVATYSSRGPSRLDLILKPDLVAPGNLVISTQAQGSTLAKAYNGTNQIRSSSYTTLTLGSTSPTYFRLSGTSMATPVVAGAVAQLLQKDPTLSPDTVKLRLMLSADKMAAWNDADGHYNPLTYGAGYLDIPAAAACTAVAGQYAMSPDLSQDTGGSVSINMDTCLWGKNALWGANINDLTCLWGKNALWGSNTLSSSACLWGKSVWTDTALWGASTDAVDLSSVVIKGE